MNGNKILPKFLLTRSFYVKYSSTLTWSYLPSLHYGRDFHTLTTIKGIFSCKNANLVIQSVFRVTVFFVSAGAPVVLGGFGSNGVLNTLEILNGTSWEIQLLDSYRYGHAMVELPCLLE